MIYMPIAMAALGLIYMLVKKSWVMKQDAGDGKMKEISDHIYEGALAFLNAEYRLLAIFVVIVSVLLFVVSHEKPQIIRHLQLPQKWLKAYILHLKMLKHLRKCDLKFLSFYRLQRLVSLPKISLQACKLILMLPLQLAYKSSLLPYIIFN